LLHEMLTAVRPFRGTTPYETAAQILGNARAAVHVGIPRALASVIDRCLCARPGDRYLSALEFAAALKRVNRQRCALEKRRVRPSIGTGTALSRDSR
jgi:hypothetical protein